MLLIGALIVPVGWTQSLKVLYDFKGYSNDGGGPDGPLLKGRQGFYGTTYDNGSFGGGVLFLVDSKGNEAILHNFNAFSGDGAAPSGGLARDTKGNVYGTTIYGGSFGDGAVYELDAAGNYSIFYSFSDAAYPQGLINDSAGNLYGATLLGGTSNCGIVYRLDPTGNKTTLYNFPDCYTYGGTALTRDSTGNLYGSGGIGTYGWGTLIKISKKGAASVLYNFTGGPDGGYPAGGLLKDKFGNLYGTAWYGGAYEGGTLFKLDSAGNFTVLHNFGLKPDGAYPLANLVQDSKGNLYSTTSAGGAYGWGSGMYGYGTIFTMDTAGNETVLYSFTDGADGSDPQWGVLRDSKGRLYGTSRAGAIQNCPIAHLEGCGAVFEFVP
jgi:uncharacterized repeat protein (TIGR03803 family)